ncbi:MAG: hypothetical protein FWF63_00695 [Fibromonadales bacterium]|nr:hypothetical protein [Fibromonadales bacterium]
MSRIIALLFVALIGCKQQEYIVRDDKDCFIWRYKGVFEIEKEITGYCYKERQTQCKEEK